MRNWSAQQIARQCPDLAAPFAVGEAPHEVLRFGQRGRLVTD